MPEQLAPPRVTDEEGVHPADQDLVPKVSLLCPAWDFVVSIHGNPTQASTDLSCSGRFSYWGAGTSFLPGLAMSKAHPGSVYCGTPCCSAHFCHLSPDPLPSPTLLSLKRPNSTSHLALPASTSELC